MKAAPISLEVPTEDLESARTEFADMVIACAIECRNNAELLDRLKSDLPKDYLSLVAEGSTRRAYSTPLGVVVKVQREDVAADPLSDEEMEWRGGIAYLAALSWRRRSANLSEIIYATVYPQLMPKQYGFLGSFGVIPKNPSVLITETARPLNFYFPKDCNGIKTSDMGIDSDGKLWIFDDRVTPQKRPAHLIPFGSMSGADEDEIWLGNLGVVPGGKFVFVDRSDHGLPEQLLSQWTLNPQEWGWTLSGTSAQTLEFSQNMFSRYQVAQKGGKNGC